MILSEKKKHSRPSMQDTLTDASMFDPEAGS